MSQAEPIHVGLVGCGLHGGAMAQALVRSGAFRLVATADPDAQAARRVADAAADTQMYASLDEMLAASDVDAIVIATPHDVLAPLSLAAIRAGKHVLVEKPMAMDEQEAKAVEFAAASASVACMVGYSFRFWMASFVRDILEAGAVGGIRSMTGGIALPPMNKGWTSTRHTGGGPLLYVGCHLIDLLMWFTGEEPTRVYANVQRRAETDADDISAMQLGFGANGIAQLLVTQSAAAFLYDLSVIGTAGSVGLRGRGFLQFEIEVQSNVLQQYREPTIIRPAARRDHITSMLVPEVQEFARAIEERRPPSVTASDGRRCFVFWTGRGVGTHGASCRTRRASARCLLDEGRTPMRAIETGRATLEAYLDALAARGAYGEYFDDGATMSFTGQTAQAVQMLKV